MYTQLHTHNICFRAVTSVSTQGWKKENITNVPVFVFRFSLARVYIVQSMETVLQPVKVFTFPTDQLVGDSRYTTMAGGHHAFSLASHQHFGSAWCWFLNNTSSRNLRSAVAFTQARLWFWCARHMTLYKMRVGRSLRSLPSWVASEPVSLHV